MAKEQGSIQAEPADRWAKSIADVREGARHSFPTARLSGVRSALCLFGAASQGRTDLIHVLDAGIAEVTVVDPSAPKLAAIARNFPGSWTYTRGNCAEIARELASAGRSFDLVICEGGHGTVDHIWEDLLPLALSLTNHSVVARLTGDLLADYALPATPAGAGQLLGRLHDVPGAVVDLVRRSSGSGGTFWAVVERSAEPRARSTDAAPGSAIVPGNGSLPHLAVRVCDLLGRSGCADLPECRRRVNEFRVNVVNKEEQGIYRVLTSARLAALPPRKVDRLEKTAACIDLARFPTISEVRNAAHTVTTKKGRVTRMVARAERLGYRAQRFDARLFVPDMHAIHASKEIRGGKPMRADYRRSIEEMGGYPAVKYEFEAPACSLHQVVHWGVFRPDPGHRQGDVQTDSRLVGYIRLYGYGNHCWYSRIMGHADYLPDGIMYLLHFAVIEALLPARSAGLEYVFYGGYHSGPRDGSLTQWKQRCLFKPAYIVYDDSGDWRGPAGMRLLDPGQPA